MAIENKTLLLAGPQHFDERRPVMGAVKRFFEYLDPLGIAIVATYLNSADYETKFATMSPGRTAGLEDLIDSVNKVFISARNFDIGMAQDTIRLAKKMGKIVVAGGYGPTFSPKAFEDCDAIVKGEFEPVARVLIDDMASGRLKGVYDSTGLPPFDLKEYVRPNRKIFPKFPKALENLRRHPQEWQRGCTNFCGFCSPTRMQRGGGNEVRHRSVEDIIDEIEAMDLKPGQHLFSTDLNSSAIPREVLQPVFKYLKERGIRWYTEGTVAPLIADLEKYGTDDSLLKLMSAKDGGGGCNTFLYGADDLSRTRVAGSKDKEMAMLEKAVTVFREMAIPLNLSVVVGLENHKFPETFFVYANALKELKAPFAFVHLATPYPGTPWGEQIISQGNIIDNETIHYNHRIPVFQPKNMSIKELQNGYYWLGKMLSKPEEITGIFKRNFDPKLAIDNSYLAFLETGMLWGIQAYLTHLELSARGYVDEKIMNELDLGYKEWLSRG